MEFGEIISKVLPLIYVIVGIALIWLAIELIQATRRVSKAVRDVQEQIKPALENVEHITASLKPVVSRVDPLVERVSLTVDAANLELMRVDGILENVGNITDSLSSAVEALDTVTNAPVELVTSVTSRVRKTLKSRRASNESIALGQAKAKQDTTAQIGGAIGGGQKEALPGRPDLTGLPHVSETAHVKGAESLAELRGQSL